MRKILATIFCLALTLSMVSKLAYAQTATPTPTLTDSQKEEAEEKEKNEKKNELEKEIQDLESKISELNEEQESLASQIEIADSQISVSELKIANTQGKISALQDDIGITEDKIEDYEGSLDLNTHALINRIIAIYEVGKIEPWEILLTSDSVRDFLTRLTYLKIVQEHDKKMILAAEQAKVSYANTQDILGEKVTKEVELQEELSAYNTQLEEDKKAKQRLLDETKGSEREYQRLLAETRAEYNAIQGIIEGRGTETDVGHINEGERIASIIQGASCNSGGTHLHFIVKEGGSAQNPFNYLTSIDHVNNSGGDSFNPSGSWRWPIDPTVELNQGYGVTWAVNNLPYIWYSFHDGLDISTTGSQTVRAVKSGTLYQGSYSGSGGCVLPYVKLKHDSENIETYYLHIYY